MDVSVFAAFVAGLISFLSPCVLPLVPGYVSMLSGIGVEQLKEGQAPRGSLLSSALAFVIGFSIVFITFGASASAVGAFLVRNRNLLAPIAGALIVLFGLHLIGWLVKISVKAGLAVGVLLILAGIVLSLRPGAAGASLKDVEFYAVAIIFLVGPVLTRWLNRDIHFRKLGGQPGPISGFLMGFAFAFGWTPCIGPILAAVLAVAATRETIGQGVFLLACYSAGLAIPFLVTAFGIGGFLKFYQQFRRHLHTVEVFSGVLLLLIGGLVFANRLTWLSNKLAFLNNPLNAIEGTLAPSGIRQGASNEARASAPEVSFEDLKGNKVDLASFRGKVVLVNFWATWCEPCRVEIPWMMDFERKYGSRGFAMLGVAAGGEDKSVVEPFVEKARFDVNGQPTPMDYPIVLGTDESATKFGGLIGLPTSVLISRDGKIIKRYVGLANREDLEKEIQSNL
jgi:cytochrome c-type biogenesis protein